MRFFIRVDSAERVAALHELTEYDYFKTAPRDAEGSRRAAFFAKEIDFAYFAARLGWSLSDYEACTPVQLMFVRKELETVTVSESNLMKDAVQVAVANALSKKKSKLWQKANKRAKPLIKKKETKALKKLFERQTPWTPWNSKGVNDGRLHSER